MYIPIEELKKATELTRAGKLMEATEAIQRALGRNEANEVQEAQAPARRQTAEVMDIEFREAPHGSETVRAREGEPPQKTEETSRPTPQGTPATFELHRFASGTATYAYRLYVPPRTDDTPLPVIVMLHGCTQDSADFAAGTAMNEMAAQRGCIVVYPEQMARANSMRCWNWFEPAHQRRGAGEPEMIAALARHVVREHGGDAQRVYVAGLSAGGAMALLAAQLYPDVFAAAGVHSGLPMGVASDVASAHAAMRKPPRRSGIGASAAPVPTIVFHGRADRTVHPDNARMVVDEAVARAEAAGAALTRQEQKLTAAGRKVTRTIYSDDQRRPRVEHWDITGAAHVWSGGSKAGSYTDPSGPAASAAMVEFFLRQRL